ncbi:DUF47 domain-containing protein [Anaerotalea alkaliphila]|uniref:DUF47 family protein n=1 Tax=Anaerotalea alkaliphila TaxID=2662126 RepID=A0A7X5KNJ4_9FIRM|nr:DUF47 family protein [Anaerotalea alkaliphila]NDL67863.1 DUF47 family protein [Anaerotalea alkaliphila]
MFNSKKKGKGYDYIGMFAELSGFSIQAAEFLDTTLKGYRREDMPEKLARMHEIEHGADVAKHDMLKKLLKEFLPPIDKDDIILLSHKIDSVTDAVEDVLIFTDVLNVPTIPREVTEFTELILECCMQMRLALVEFKEYRKSKELHARLGEVNRLKSKGKALYVNHLRNLYQMSEDPVRMLVYTEIFKKLERCCIKCKNVTNTVERIVMKNL